MFITFGDKFNALTLDSNLRDSYLICFIKTFLSFPLHIQLSGQGHNTSYTCSILLFPVSSQELIYYVYACVWLGFFVYGFPGKYIKKELFLKRAFRVGPDSSLTYTHANPENPIW